MDANDSESNDESPNIIDDNHNESANIIVMNPQHVALSSMDNRNESANAMDASLSSMDNRNVSANVMNVSLSSMNGSVSDQVMDVSLSSINHNVMNDAQSDEVPANCLIESLWAEASTDDSDLVHSDGGANDVADFDGVANGVADVDDVHAFGDEGEIVDDPLYNCYMPLPAPALGATVNEFSTPFLMAAAFPTLFANKGLGDPTSKQRRRTVEIGMAVRHLLYYPDKNDDGTYYYRFASHPCFAFWCHNMLRRHSGLKQTSFVCGADPTV
eukprot:813074_1